VEVADTIHNFGDALRLLVLSERGAVEIAAERT